MNVRLIAATHRNLERRIEDGSFRADLYFRLRVIEIHLPPLRDRGGDLDQLAEFLLDKTCRRLNRPLLRFAPPAIEAIRTYAWPGNVRELENAIERAVILCEGTDITPALLAIERSSSAREGASGSAGEFAFEQNGRDPGNATKNGRERNPGAPLFPFTADTAPSLEDYFRRFVLEHQGHLSETELAKRLGLSRKALWERRHRMGLPRVDPRAN